MRGRRRFLLQSIALSRPPLFSEAKQQALPGRSDRTHRPGNFGHGLDSVWKLHPETTIAHCGCRAEWLEAGS